MNIGVGIQFEYAKRGMGPLDVAGGSIYYHRAEHRAKFSFTIPLRMTRDSSEGAKQPQTGMG